MRKVTYRDLLQLVAEHREQYLAGIAFLAISNFLAFLVPLIGKFTIDGIIEGNTAHLPAIINTAIRFFGGKRVFVQNLWIAGALLIVVSSLSGLFLYWRDKAAIYAGEFISRDLRNRLFDHLHRLPNVFHAKSDTGDLVQRCTSDIETLRIFLSKQVVEIGNAAGMPMLAVPMMLTLHVPLTFVSLILIPVLVGFSLRLFQRIQQIFLDVDEAEGALTTVIQENLSGIRVVRAFARQNFEREKFAVVNEQYRDREMRLMRLFAWFWAITDLICMGQIALVLFVGGWLATRHSITVGALFAFIGISGMVLWPIRHMGRVLADTGKALVAFGRIAAVLEEPPESEIGETPPGFPDRLTGAISFENVSFSYRPGVPVIQDFTCRISPGETVAVVGPTGSGKSTLVRLLLRFYDYREGSIQIDGFELNRIDRKRIRSQIGAALQEPFLFARTLRDNIKLGKPRTDDLAMKHAAKVACVHDAIMAFRWGYDTVVGEKGVTLSGGQAQRVTLSRTILRDSPILILDDSFSAVDMGTEREILEMLDRRRGRATTILITHRLSCCLQADRILVLDQGRLAQQGSHETLMAEPGFYQNVWQMQGSWIQGLDNGERGG